MTRIKGIDCELSHVQTIVLLKGSDGLYYAQSGALCKCANPYTAVRRCMACLRDYEFARRHDLYLNGELNPADDGNRNEELHRCLSD